MWLLPPIAFVMSSSSTILNWKELAPVESLYTCQCKTITFAYKKYYKLKSEKDYVLCYYAVSILPKNVLVERDQNLNVRSCYKYNTPGLKTVSWGQCTSYFSLVSADQSVQQKLLKNKNKHRNKLIASLLIRLCLASSVKDESDRVISYKAVSWLADKQHFRFGQTEENRDCCAAPVKSKSQRK